MHSVSTRRQWLQRSGLGIGGLALSALLADESARAASNPLAPRAPHFAPKAKRIIQIMLDGAPSHVDTFDPKPALNDWHGRSMAEHGHPEIGLRSPFAFKKHGQSGLELSEAFTKLGEVADDLCVIRSMKTDVPDHEPGLRMMTTGDTRLPRPSLGSWLVYGLGSENQSLPGFVSLAPFMPLEADYWQSAFLPASYQATRVETQNRELRKLLENIRSPHANRAAQREQLTLLEKLNAKHRSARPDDERLDARVRSFELAFAMQQEAAEAFDLAREPVKTRELYGDSEQGRQLLIARRLIERGVRCVQAWHGGWDHHANIQTDLGERARDIDQPLAALLMDLKRTGLLNETLVIIGGEFGRTPSVDGGQGLEGAGRGHWHEGFSIALAGGGVKGGVAYGATDELGWKAVENPVHVHDLHATILHLMGFDHEKLVYRYAGRDFRLTDVHGKVVKGVIA